MKKYQQREEKREKRRVRFVERKWIRAAYKGIFKLFTGPNVQEVFVLMKAGGYSWCGKVPMGG
jgi:hypothetical protein